MLLEALRRAETAVKEAFALASAGGVCCGELRDALVVTKTVAGVVAAAQTQLAAAVAKAERHGDGGTGVLVEMTGLTRREARGQVKTAETIAGVPSVRDAVARGVVSLANAKRLADAVERTSAGAVGAAEGLLKMAEMMRADDFTKQTRRWIAEQQDDGGEADYERIRARRCVRVWDSDNGMVELHGTFDAFTGRRIGNRLRAEANRLYQNDKKHAAQHGTRTREGGHGRGRSQNRQPGSSKRRDGGRTFDQCMADALDNLTSNTVTAPTTHTASAADVGKAAIIGNSRTACTDTGHAGDARTEATMGNSQGSCTGTKPADTGTPISDGQMVCTGTSADTGTPIGDGQMVCTGTSADTGTPIGDGQMVCTGTKPADTGTPIGDGQMVCTGTKSADTGTPIGDGQMVCTGTKSADTGTPIGDGQMVCTGTKSADTGTPIGDGQMVCTGTKSAETGAPIGDGQMVGTGSGGGGDPGLIVGGGQAARTGADTGTRTRSCTDSDLGSEDSRAVMVSTTGSDVNTVAGLAESGTALNAGGSTGTATNVGNRAGVAAGADPNTCTCRGAGTGEDASVSSGSTGLGRAFADICVIVQVDAVTGDLVAQLPDGERLPASVLDKLTCNARISVILSNARGRPIWRAVAARIANETQRQLLLAHWGGCFHCAAHWKMCQIHHIVPVAQGGETKLDNLIPVCWDCHDLIHHNHWQIHKRPDGYHTLHPPVQRHHGPAHAPEQPLLFTRA